MNYALIGCGRIAVNHIKAAVSNNFNIVAVCDVVENKMDELLSKYNLENDKSIKHYINYKEMIEKENVELVSIVISLYKLNHLILLFLLLSRD